MIRVSGSRAAARTERKRLALLENDNAVAKAAAKADAFVASFVAMTPAQVDAYVTANVTDLASAKALLKKMSLMLLLLAKQSFRD